MLRGNKNKRIFGTIVIIVLCLGAVCPAQLPPKPPGPIPVFPDKPWDPDPADGEIDVEVDAVLSWTGGGIWIVGHGPYLIEYDVYFGGMYKGRQSATSYDPGGLEPCETYNWHIDQVEHYYEDEGEFVLVKTGDDWSFTTAIVCEAGWDVSNVRLNGSGTSMTVDPGDSVRLQYDFEVWNGSDVPYAIRQVLAGLVKGPWSQVIDGCAYNGIPDVCPSKTSGSFDDTFNAPTEPGTYHVVAAMDAQYTCDDAKNRFPEQANTEAMGTITVESESTKASNPYPVDGATDVPIDVVLSWTPGDYATSHDVYFGTSSPPTFVGNYDDDGYNPGGLEPGTIYYWQINEVVPVVEGPPIIIEGDVWRFATAHYLRVRDLKEPTPKGQFCVRPRSLELMWNVDQGEEGRGKGEIYLQTWIRWPAKSLEQPNSPERREFGPVGGDDEFPTGTVIEDPCKPCGYRFVCGRAVVGKYRTAYYNMADCPLPNYVVVDVLVLEEDTNAGLMALVNIVTRIIKTGVGKIPGVSIATDVVSKLIDGLTTSKEGEWDPVGRSKEGVIVEFATKGEIDEFCDCKKKWIKSYNTIPLDSLVTEKLWREAEFKKKENIEDEGFEWTTLKELGCPVPDKSEIGTLELDFVLAKMGTSSHEINEGAASSKEIGHADIGQHDESTISASLGLGAALPSGPTLGELGALSSDPILRKYSMFLDVDNDLATGAQGSPYDGAEFELVAEFDNSYSPTYKLMQYNSDTDVFEEVPGGIYDGAINIDRAAIFLHVELSTLGDPVGPIAAWGMVQEQGVVVDVLPEHPTQLALGLTPSYTYSGVPPMVVTTDPPHDAIDVDRETPIGVRFSKSMARPEAEAVFSMNPPVAGSFAWQGNTVIFTPYGLLEPMRRYEVTIDPNATDRIGTLFDGNGDLTPGDSFTWEFITAGLPLFCCDVNYYDIGYDCRHQDISYEGEPIYVTGTEFYPFSEVEIYIVRHARAELVPGAELIDVTDTGSTLATIDAEGILPPTFVGSIAKEGEYNIIVDVNSNGFFDPGIDRCDRTGIGFAVFPEYQPLTDGLVAYYPLENDANDNSGNGHHGEVRGSPTYVPGPAGYGTAMHFDGAILGNYVDLGTFNPSAATGQLSIALWAKWDGLTNHNYQALIAKRDRWSATGMMWHIETYRYTGLFRFGSHKDSNVGISGPLPVGEWTHVALTFDGTTAKFYINGELDASGPSSLGPKTDASVVLAAVEGTGAKTPGACPFNGALDEIHIYDRPLTQAEILYLAGS